MHAVKHALLRAAHPALSQELHEEARRLGITVDDLVMAMLGRGVKPVRAVEEAGDALVAKYADAIDELATWPSTCPFCSGLVEPGAEAKCITCKKLGCATCVTGKGCPPCAAEQRVRIEKARESVS